MKDASILLILNEDGWLVIKRYIFFRHFFEYYDKLPRFSCQQN